MKITTGSWLALTALALLGAPALANVDVEIDAKAKVKGTLQPEGEVETLRFAATRGATLAVVLSAKKKAPLDFDVELRAPDDSVVDLSGAPKFVDKGKKVTVKKLALPQTGEYRLIVRATGEGEYAAKVTVVPAKKPSVTEAFAASEQRVVNVAIPAGSKVTLTAKAGDGGAAPRMDSLGGIDLSAAGTLGDTSHTVKKLEVAEGGELPLTITNRADVAGDVTITLKVAPPKVKTLKLDIRGKELGKVAGGETAVSRTIEAAAGGVVQIVDPQSDLSGVAVDIPGGALPVSTRITIASSLPPALPDPSSQGAGPAVSLGPAGTTFASAATITLRFDPDSLPIGIDPLTDLRVIRVKADGTTETITPTSVDLVAGTMELPTSGFSIFQPITPAGLPNLAGKDYWTLSIYFSLLPDFQRMTGDSRIRFIDGDIGLTSFGEIDTSGSAQSRAVLNDRTVDHDDLGNGLVDSFFETANPFGSWSYDGDVVVVTDEEEEDELRFLPTADGSFLMGEPNFEPGDEETQLNAMLRAHDGPLTMSQIAGDYTIGFFSIFAEEAPSGPVHLGAERAFGTLKIRNDGSATVQLDARAGDFDSGQFGTPRETVRETGQVTMISDSRDPLFGALRLQIDGDEEAPALVLLPGQDMGAFLGSTDGADDSNLFLVGVRQQPGFSRQDATGFYRTGGMDVEPMTYDINGVTIPDFNACTVRGEAFYGGGNSVDVVDQGERCVFRDGNIVPDGIFIDVDTFEDEETIGFSVAKDGSFRVRGEESDRGAFGPGTSFAFLVIDPAETSEQLFGMSFLIRPPMLPER